MKLETIGLLLIFIGVSAADSEVPLIPFVAALCGFLIVRRCANGSNK